MKLISSLVSINKHICRYTFSHLLHDLLQVHSCSFVLSWFSWPSDFIMNKWYESISFACLMSPRLPEHPKNTTNLQLLTVLIQRSTQMITYNPQSAIDVRSVESLFFKCCFFSISVCSYSKSAALQSESGLKTIRALIKQQSGWTWASAGNGINLATTGNFLSPQTLNKVQLSAILGAVIQKKLYVKRYFKAMS